MTTTKKSTFVWKVLITIIGCSILYALFSHKIPEVMGHIKNTKTSLFFLALFGYIVANILAAARLSRIFYMQGINFSLFKTWGLIYIGYFFNIFMPSSVGGDVAKGYYAYKYSGEKGRSYIAVIVDRIVGLLSMGILCCVAIFMLQGHIPEHQRFICIVFLLGIIGMSGMGIYFFASKRFARSFLWIRHIIRSEKIVGGMRKVYLLVHECSKHPIPFLQALMLSVLFQVATIAMMFVLGYALGIRSEINIYYMYMPFIYIFSMLPSINGLGVREGAFVYFFSKSIPSEQAFALSLLVDVFLYTCSFIGFIYYITHKTGSITDITKNAEAV